MPRPTALCFMPEFSNQLGGVLVQWSMGLLLSLETSFAKGWRGDPSSYFQVGNFMTKKNKPRSNQTTTKERGGFGVMISFFTQIFHLQQKKRKKKERKKKISHCKVVEITSKISQLNLSLRPLVFKDHHFKAPSALFTVIGL